MLVKLALALAANIFRRDKFAGRQKPK